MDLELIKRLAATTKCKSLQHFLYKDFSCISKDYAGAGPSQLHDLVTLASSQRARRGMLCPVRCLSTQFALAAAQGQTRQEPGLQWGQNGLHMRTWQATSFDRSISGENSLRAQGG